MVSNASDDLPDPESPVSTTKLSRGMSTSMFFRLCSRAPRTRMSCMDRWDRRCEAEVYRPRQGESDSEKYPQRRRAYSPVRGADSVVTPPAMFVLWSHGRAIDPNTMA